MPAAPKYYEWVLYFYDGTVMTHYMPEAPDLNTFERSIEEAEQYHNTVSKVKRAGWVAISVQKATAVNIKARYLEAISKPLPAKIIECHGEFPLIKRVIDINYGFNKEGDLELIYYYLIGLGGTPIEHIIDGKTLIEYVGGQYSILDNYGNERSDNTSFVIPALPPEMADGMPHIKKEIEENLKG